ncbi:MAG: class I SAM-dependent methyltransferase [Candidatus Abyssubacteria bacterium]
MQPEEYGRLGAIDERHWYYRGKRIMVTRWLERLAGHLPEGCLLEVGIGTGRLAESLSAKYSIVGVDDSQEALSLARERIRYRLIRGTLLELPIKSETCSAVIALDVLEHLENDQTGLAEMLRVSKDGGLLLINVPAFQFMWSSWDERLGHKRRYSKRAFRRLLQETSVEIIHLGYLNSLLFLPIIAYRKLMRRSGDSGMSTRLEDYLPPEPVNGFLERLFIAQGLGSLPAIPFGTSLFCVLRKKHWP